MTSNNSELRDREILKILNSKAPGTVAIFECKNFYKCYGEDAQIVASDILVSNVGLQNIEIGSENIQYQNLNNAQYIRVVRDLLLLFRYRVELYEEADGNKFALKAKGVLGNVDAFEEIVSDCAELAELSTVMCAMLINDDLSNENKISLVFCNSQDLRITFAELDDTTNFTLFEQCAVALCARECLLIKENAKQAPSRFKKLEMAIQRTGMNKVYVEEVESDVNKCKREMKALLDRESAELAIPSVQWIILHVLLSSMRLLDDKQYEQAFSTRQYGAAGYIFWWDISFPHFYRFLPFVSLLIWEFLEACPAGSSATLHSHLDRCRSKSGKRLIREWMRRPLFNLRQIEERLNVVEALHSNASVCQALHDDYLRRVPDVTLLARKLAQKRATLQDCYRTYQLIMLLDKIHQLMDALRDELDEQLWASVDELVLQQVNHSMAEFAPFVKLIRSTLDFEFYKESGQLRIRPDIDEELKEINSQLRDLDGKAERASSKMADLLNCEVRVESNTFGYFFRVTLKSEKSLRGIREVNVIESTKGGVRFSTNDLELLSDEHRALTQSYDNCQSELTRSVISTCASYTNALHLLSERIGVIDVLTSFAYVASSSTIPYCRPKLLEKGTGVFELRECRHPVVEELPSIQFIPNDALMGGENTDCRRFMVLTGANMGGKSTYLKSAALCVLMAQMGSFVACSSATFSLIDGIYTRVGAGDFQCKGISTFMAEMMDCATILEKATKNSLIVIDELGRGTSTYDGFGLAWAIAEDILTRIDCFTIFATHFHEISKLEEKHSGNVKNYKMDTLIDKEKLTFLFGVVPGVAERSFGLNIAKMVGFSDSLLKDSERILSKLESTNTIGTVIGAEDRLG